MPNLASEQADSPSREVYSGADSGAVLRLVASRTADKQAAFLLPHLRPGMELLDCGCGLGSITVGLARVVAPGQVVGIDKDASQIERTQKYAFDQNIPNLRFETANLYALPFPEGSFDVVFSHAVLTHLGDPLTALREIYRVLKPGGVVGIRNADFDGHLLTPADPLLLHFWQILGMQFERNGGSPYLGKQQRALLRQAGFRNVQASASYDCYGTAEATRHWAGVMAGYLREDKSVKQFVEYGLAERPELERMSQAWLAWGEHPEALFADAYGEAVGWKA
jgi:ubiquinone/menaquinone biosynthesis C-methylase UbiE